VPESTIRGFANIFGDHFHPIIAVLAPLYWIVPAAETLLLAQAVLFAASIVPVFLFLRLRLPHPAAVALSVAYGLFWGLQRAVASDFHEIAFAPVVIATVIYAIDRRKWLLLAVASLVLTAVKEDLIPVLTFAGLYMMGRGDRAKGLALVAWSLAAFAAIVGLMIPALNGSGQYAYAGTYDDIVARPWTALATLVSPPVKLETAFLWLAPFCFLPLRSPLIVLLIPLALVRFLSETPTHWGTSFHYSASVAPIVAMSAGDGLARLVGGMRAAERGQRRVIGYLAGTSVMLCSLLPGHLHLWRLLSPSYYEMAPGDRTGYRALEAIPADASVVAQTAIVPHLSQRKQLYLLDSRALDGDYLVACARLSAWPANSFTELAAIIEQRRGRGDGVVFDEDGWLVLRRNR
jgi:uncharacterized membrane protein